MPSPLQYGSVCSGIEAASLAWRPLGWQAAWFSEIDPFACAVLAHHYPSVPNLGDMTTIAARILSGEVPAPDILVGGTPCQPYSSAGTRRGLADPRGSLTLHYAELANAVDPVRQSRNLPPVVLVWENVPGILSDRANAFGAFLGVLAGEGRALEPPGGKWTHAGDVSGVRRRIAWRVLDSGTSFGLAQRRNRLFLVASGRAGFDPGEVLFERQSLSGHPAPGGETRQEVAGIAACRADCPNRTFCFGGGNTRGPIERAACLTAKGNRCDFEEETLAVQCCTGPLHTSTTANRGKGCGEDGSGRGVSVIAFAQNSRNEVRLMAGHGRIVGALSACGGGKPGQGRPVVLNLALRGRAGGTMAELGDELASALRASGGNGSGARNYVAETPPRRPLAEGERIWRVRRLMPVECERLQGLCPDNYTLVPYRGKPAADAPRYRVIGNSMAVPCMAWLGRRLQDALARKT
jgi:DNA (cytosine-5)-methyltransferase 1